MEHFQSVDAYINSFRGTAKERVIAMRHIIREALPNAEERISYNIPAYFVDQKLVIYFAGYENHIGMYPGRTNSDAYNQLAAKYASGKSTARFSHNQPLPKDVITTYIRVRLDELGLTQD